MMATNILTYIGFLCILLTDAAMYRHHRHHVRRLKNVLRERGVPSYVPSEQNAKLFRNYVLRNMTDAIAAVVHVNRPTCAQKKGFCTRRAHCTLPKMLYLTRSCFTKDLVCCYKDFPDPKYVMINYDAEKKARKEADKEAGKETKKGGEKKVVEGTGKEGVEGAGKGVEEAEKDVEGKGKEGVEGAEKDVEGKGTGGEEGAEKGEEGKGKEGEEGAEKGEEGKGKEGEEGAEKGEEGKGKEGEEGAEKGEEGKGKEGEEGAEKGEEGKGKEGEEGAEKGEEGAEKDVEGNGKEGEEGAEKGEEGEGKEGAEGAEQETPSGRKGIFDGADRITNLRLDDEKYIQNSTMALLLPGDNETDWSWWVVSNVTKEFVQDHLNSSVTLHELQLNTVLDEFPDLAKVIDGVALADTDV